MCPPQNSWKVILSMHILVNISTPLTTEAHIYSTVRLNASQCDTQPQQEDGLLAAAVADGRHESIRQAEDSLFTLTQRDIFYKQTNGMNVEIDFFSCKLQINITDLVINNNVSPE